jgi:hypothetical protein
MSVERQQWWCTACLEPVESREKWDKQERFCEKHWKEMIETPEKGGHCNVCNVWMKGGKQPPREDGYEKSNIDLNNCIFLPHWWSDLKFYQFVQDFIQEKGGKRRSDAFILICDKCGENLNRKISKDLAKEDLEQWQKRMQWKPEVFLQKCKEEVNKRAREDNKESKKMIQNKSFNNQPNKSNLLIPWIIGGILGVIFIGIIVYWLFKKSRNYEKK